MTASRSRASNGGGVHPPPIHLVGSVPLPDPTAVFRTVSETLDGRIGRLPDGETGARLRWMGWMLPAFERTEGLQFVDPPPDYYTPHKHAVLPAGAKEPTFARIGISDGAQASYEAFAQLKREGVIAAHTRFQVGIATPCSPAIALMAEESRAAIEPAFERQVLIELAEICEAIPHDDLAVQWDVCCEVGIWSGDFPAYFPDVRGGITARLKRAIDAVPPGVDVGIHLCYGDFAHAHFAHPDDLGVLVDMASSFAAAADRRLDWLHLPVPIDRDDEAYFAPLADLSFEGETELYLGLVHLTDGVDGAMRRVRAARNFVDGFGISTECGFGRRPPESVVPLLELHVQVSEALDLA